LIARGRGQLGSWEEGEREKPGPIRGNSSKLAKDEDCRYCPHRKGKKKIFRKKRKKNFGQSEKEGQRQLPHTTNEKNPLPKLEEKQQLFRKEKGEGPSPPTEGNPYLF